MHKMKISGVVVNVLRKHNEDIEFLYLKRSAGSFQNEWWPVAGSLEAVESPVDAALRELQEETGLQPSGLYYLGIDLPQYDGNSKLATFVAFVLLSDCVCLNEEHSDYCWITIDEVYRIVPETAHWVIGRIKEKFIDQEPDESSLAWPVN